MDDVPLVQEVGELPAGVLRPVVAPERLWRPEPREECAERRDDLVRGGGLPHGFHLEPVRLVIDHDEIVVAVDLAEVRGQLVEVSVGSGLEGDGGIRVSRLPALTEFAGPDVADDVRGDAGPV